MSAPAATKNIRMLSGNDACALGAMAAGLTFYAGYPITPSSEVAEVLAVHLPKSGGVFVQMEDEIASMGAIIGASVAGAKSMTATSGPGFSLMQENLGYAAMTEVPCVVVNVMRGGPSTGLPTMPAQGDFMQSRWGTHGDHPIIVLSPYSVRETYDLTIRAFNLSEKYRSPVVLLMDETVAHVMEKVEMPETGSFEVINRVVPTCAPEDYLPYQHTESGVSPMAPFGTGYRFHVTGLYHDQTGFPTNNHDEIDKLIRRLHRKIEQARPDIVQVDELMMDDAELGVIAFGSAARACRMAVRQAREQGVKVGLFRPITLWPFCDQELEARAEKIKKWVVVEMSLGQFAHEVEWAIGRNKVVGTVQRVDGSLIRPEEVLAAIQEAK